MRTSLLLIPVLVLLSGCIGQATRPSVFYALNSEPGTTVEGAATRAAPLSLGLGPVVLPDLFDRPQIVTRPDANRVELSEYHRWGGDLNQNLNRVLARNLMGRLHTDAVALYPWPHNRVLDYQVTIQFYRFDGNLGQAVQLEGVWRLLDGRAGCELAVQRFELRETSQAGNYDAFVSAMSRGVAQLSDVIAGQVLQAEPGCAAD